VKTWFLSPPYLSDDIDWINNSGLDYEIESPYEAGDSGWCDMGTGQQIITSQHKIFLKTCDDKEETWLMLKYDNRVKILSRDANPEELEKLDF
jgi:hypothetical protein